MTINEKGERGVKLLSVLLVSVLLTACAGASSEENHAPASAPSAGGGEDALTLESCDAEAVAYAVGERFDEANLARFKSASGARQVRVLRPDEAATMEHRPERLNIHLERNGAIASLDCG